MDRKLPDWLKESREAEKLIAWLKSPDCEVKEFSGQLFIKARYGNCFFFFDCLKENRKTDRNWCAVIHMPEYSLYEAEDLFLNPIGIPDDFGFPVREDLIPKLETQISHIGKKLIREQWDELLLKGGYAAAQMIPEISRVYIQLNADRFIKKGKRPEDLIYQPQFHFADMKWEFSDWMFLEYLSNPQRAAELFAQKWLLEKLPEISKKKICIGCIREEMEEMLKKTGTGPEVSLPRSA